jgi:ubiquinone/menaquinone biosynthesis C-methylase UbiE
MKLFSQTKRLQQFLKQEVGRSARILDIGCGDGAAALYLISSYACAVQGIDLDAGRIHRANKKFKQRPRKGFAVCNVLKAEKISRRFFGKSFKAVIIIHALHHVQNIAIALRKAKNVLDDDGKIIIAEYETAFGEKVDNCPRFSAGKIKALVKNAGFQRIKKVNMSSGFFAIIGHKN